MDIIDISYPGYWCFLGTKVMPDEMEDFFRHRIWDHNMWKWCYYRGYREPRYPVPALCRIVDILPTEIVVWVCSNETTKDYRTYEVEKEYVHA
jgi:hypothetical protein